MKVRVVGLRDGLGTKKYIVQFKHFLFWHTLQEVIVEHYEVSWIDKEFSCFDKAKEYEKQELDKELAKKRKVDCYIYIGEYK
jgi:hypothetical protein